MTNKNQLKIVVASDVDYEELISEIYCDGKFIGLLQQDNGKENLKIELSPDLKSIDFEWFQNALSEAKSKLLGNS